MTSRQRMLCALTRRVPDRLPVTTHHLMESYLREFWKGADRRGFFDALGLDAIDWVAAHRPEEALGERVDPGQGELGFLEARRVVTDEWRISIEELPGAAFQTQRLRFSTPGGVLSMVVQSNAYTSWVAEPLVKEKCDIDLLGAFMPAPKCDVDAVNRAADAFGERGIIRGLMCTFDAFGQPGCWQDAVCLAGVERLILETYDDPVWVHEFLGILQQRKLVYARSLAGARYDLIELGGGSASSTVISPAIFERFVAPYDADVIDAAHAAGQRVVYHTCGGMMPLLEGIAAMGPDAVESFTPAGVGGDADLGEAKRRIGSRVCMIGGFDPLHFFSRCTAQETRARVRRCFAEAGGGGGYILAPSEPFFDADPELLSAFADEARKCAYA